MESREINSTSARPRETASYMPRQGVATYFRRDSVCLGRPLSLNRPSFIRLSSTQIEEFRKFTEYSEHKIIKPNVPKRRQLALLLPGHNEEIIIAMTIRSAVTAGQDLKDIYVVDDNSSDRTREIAIEILGKKNVLSVERSGKALAVQKAIRHFKMVSRYDWLHIADADSIFSPDYFQVYRSSLDNDYAVAIGFVQSLRGNWISTYRAISYTYGQHVFKRIQAWLGMVSVFPGPVSSFRTDILPQIEINPRNVAEDFDITLQVYRKKLGKVMYIPKAINYTQDPQSFHDFCKQSMRWYTGFFQGIQQHKIGMSRQKIDVSIGFQLIQTAFFLLQIVFILPFVMIATHDWKIPFIALMIDFTITGFIVIASSVILKRWYLLGVMPYFYFLRTAEIIMYFTAFVQVFFINRVTNTIKGWDTEGRRYQVDAQALQEIAAKA